MKLDNSVEHACMHNILQLPPKSPFIQLPFLLSPRFRVCQRSQSQIFLRCCHNILGKQQDRARKYFG